MADNKALQLLDHIGRELAMLWGQMEAWQELFDVEQEKRQALLAATAPGFFAIVQVTLAESILMRIARLMDPPRSAGQDNSTFSSLCDALSEPPNDALRRDIQALTTEWSKKDRQTRAEQGEYARLKVLRNKWLAHNDTGHKQNQPADSLWIPLTHEDFALAQRLAGMLWSIYRRGCWRLRGTAVVEPQHNPCRMENRASAVLKRLCESRFLDELIDSMPDEARLSSLAGRQAYERQQMGEDRIRHVFTRGTRSGS